MEKITKEELLENLGRTPLSDDELDKAAGGNAPNSTFCICGRFSPYDGDWNNKTYSNCFYGISAQLTGCPCPGNTEGNPHN